MWERNVFQRLLLIGIVLVLAVFLLFDFQRGRVKLLPGLDIAGGVSMIFEIQEEPGDTRDVADEMVRLLKKRVDPQGVFNLDWRVHGRNRIEVQMPLPPKENAELRDRFIESREALFTENIQRSEIESLFGLGEQAQAERIAALARGSDERQALLEQAIAAHQAYVEQLRLREQAAETQPATAPALEGLDLAVRDASEELQDAIDAVLDANLNPQRFSDMLEMKEGMPVREEYFENVRARFPQLEEQIDDVQKRYDAWQEAAVYLDSPADLRRLMSGAGVLEFRILADPSPENITKYDHLRERLQEIGPRARPGDTEGWFEIDNPISFFDLDSARELDRLDPRNNQLPYVVEPRGDTWYVLAKLGRENGLLAEQGGPKWQLQRVGVGRDPTGRPTVTFELDPVGGSLFAELTEENVGEQMAILLDDVAISAPRLSERIGGRGQITGDFSRERINYLTQTMQAGSLPARLKDTPVSERVIGSSLGESNLQKAFRAGVWGVILVGGIMAAYYFIAGLIANVALVMNIMLVLAVMAMLEARMTLAGIAGVILTIGMTVDANVLIFERMREEKERGSSLRMIVKNGYEKAFSTIIDANITTLLICVIIYFIGSEEIKGFGLTLGWGIITSLFTALFVTRTLFTLLIKYHWIKDVSMLQLIGVPSIDWYAKRKFFVPLSLAIMLIGLGLLYVRGARDTLDVEFLGGVSADLELEPAAAEQYDDARLKDVLDQVGREIAEEGRRLADATVEPVPNDPLAFDVTAPEVASTRLAAMIAEPLEDGDAGKLLQRDGIEILDDSTVRVRMRNPIEVAAVQSAIRGLGDTSGDSIPLAGENIRRAKIGQVLETAGGEETGRIWNLTTTETNKALVQHAIVAALGDDLMTRPQVTYVFRGGTDGAPLPITDRRLDALGSVPPGTPGDLTDFLGGAAIVMDELRPAQTVDELRDRIRNMRLQPDYQDLPWRPIEVFGVEQAGTDSNGVPLYKSVVVAVSDSAFTYMEDPDLWRSQLAQPELGLVMATLDTEQSLRKVTQFKPQIAAESQTQAIIALVLSWAMIIAYLWIRFGKPIYGMSGVAALIHDVLIALAFVGISGWLGGTEHVGRFILIEDFKIDMTIVAAFLTIIGYSINDTIIVFDRIRETRGRLGRITPEIINSSINQTLSRTIMTSGTTLLVLLTMYVFGGSSIRGFNYCMMIGVLTGTYSSIAVAAPLLMLSTQAERQRAPSPARPPVATAGR